MDELILSYMPLAKRVGLKYASRNGVYQDEAVAEAYFQLVILFRESPALYEHAEQKDYLVGIFVKRALIKYFERQDHHTEMEQVDPKRLVRTNMDEEMIEFLSSVCADDNEAFKVFNYLRSGVDIYDVLMVSPGLRKTAQRLAFQASARLRRLKELKRLGYPTSREVISESSVGDGCNGVQETGGEGGNDSGRTDS